MHTLFRKVTHMTDVLLCVRYSLLTVSVSVCLWCCVCRFSLLTPSHWRSQNFFIGVRNVSHFRKTAILCCFIIIMRPALEGALSVAPQSVCPSVIWRYRHQTGSTMSASQWMRSQQQHSSVR